MKNLTINNLFIFLKIRYLPRLNMKNILLRYKQIDQHRCILIYMIYNPLKANVFLWIWFPSNEYLLKKINQFINKT